MATVVTTTYAGPTTITMDLSALGSSATFIAGRESTQVDNSSTKYMDALVFGRFTVGTTPTINTQLNVYLWGNDIALTGTPPATIATVLDGTDSAETVTTTSLGALKLASFTPILVNTSDTVYEIQPFSVAALFGGVMPLFWGLFVAHNTAAALKTDANNTDEFRFLGITYTNT